MRHQFGLVPGPGILDPIIRQTGLTWLPVGIGTPSHAPCPISVFPRLIWVGALALVIVDNDDVEAAVPWLLLFLHVILEGGKIPFAKR